MVIAKNKVNLEITVSFLSGIEVGFEQNSYNVSASDGMVLVCAAIYKGTLERGVAVLLVTSSDNSSSGIYRFVLSKCLNINLYPQMLLFLDLIILLFASLSILFQDSLSLLIEHNALALESSMT